MSVAELEHSVLSHEFLRWLRDMDDLGHDECTICNPPVYDGGLHETARMYTKAIDCPVCGVQIKRGATSLVRRDYERHLWDEHNA